MVKNQIVILLLGTLLLSSCILADRSGCPTYLTLSLAKAPEDVDSLYLITRSIDGSEGKRVVHRGEFSSGYTLYISKKVSHIAVYGNVKSMIYDNGFITPYGQCCDPIYTSFISAGYNDDVAYEEVVLRKNHIRIHIKITGIILSSDTITTTLSGTSIGYNTLGEVIGGEFCHSPELIFSKGNGKETSDIICSSIVPRQMDSNLYLIIHQISEGGKKELLKVSLSDALKNSGIDMESPDLEDLYMTIDSSFSSIIISVEDFDSDEQIYITI